MNDEEEIIHTEESINESDSDQKDNNPKQTENQYIKSTNISNSNEKSEIFKKSQKVQKKAKSNLMKVFDKYHNLSKKELHILLSQKNDDIIRQNEKKEKSKKILSDLITKLNNTISKNTEILYEDEFNIDILSNLEKLKNDKKKQLENSKKMNNLFKQQLTHIKEKIANNEKEKKKLQLIDNKIDNLQKENILLKKQINLINSKKTVQNKKVEYIDNNKYSQEIKIKTEENNNFASQKHDYFTKLSMSLKSLDNIKNELKRFDEIYNSSIKEISDENLIKKINFWINLIKNDLKGDENEIVTRIKEDKSQFLKELESKNDIIISQYNSTLETLESMNNTQKKEENENNKTSIKNKNTIKSNKIYRNGLLINKIKSTSLLYSNFSSTLSTTRKNKMAQYMKTNNSGNDLEKTTLFKKLNYLKLNSPIHNMKLRLKNISNAENKNKGNNYFISEEINDSIRVNYKNNIQIPMSPNNKKISDEDINSILTGDYNQISDADYRELLDKKDQYLDSNMRLDKNIDNLRKTKNKKIAYILKIIKENDKNLQNIKKKNYLIEREINKLNNIYQLTYEQVKLENEVNKKQTNSKKKLKSDSVKKEEINTNKQKDKSKEKENKLIKSIDKNKDNDKSEEEISHKKLKIKSTDKKVRKKSGTREEKLRIIKEKYKDGNFELNDENSFLYDNEENNNNNNNSNQIINDELNIINDNKEVVSE